MYSFPGTPAQLAVIPIRSKMERAMMILMAAPTGFVA